MSHVPVTSVHRYVGDPFTLQITVEGLTEPQVTTARWACRSVVKTLGAGISKVDDGGTARLDIDITKTDTEAIGTGDHDWQAAAGGVEPPIVATGSLRLSARL